MTVTWPNVELLKTKDGGHTHIENFILAITQRPTARFDLVKICEEAVFNRISAMKQIYPRSTERFILSVWGSVSGGFGIRLRYTISEFNRCCFVHNYQVQIQMCKYVYSSRIRLVKETSELGPILNYFLDKRDIGRKSRFFIALHLTPPLRGLHWNTAITFGVKRKQEAVSTHYQRVKDGDGLTTCKWASKSAVLLRAHSNENFPAAH